MPVNLLDGSSLDTGLGMPHLGGYNGSGTPGNLYIAPNTTGSSFMPEPSSFNGDGTIPPSPDSGINGSDLIGGDTSVLPPGFDDPNITQVTDTYASGASLSQYLQEHPGMSPEDYMQYMAAHSDEWAEKYIDYLIEKHSLDEQNSYTASREDTAYQRLVQDLKAAGLNPAMMYGSTASPSSSGSVGRLNPSEGATYKSNSTTAKFKELVISMVLAQWTLTHDNTNDWIKGIGELRKWITGIGALFG